MAGFTLIEILAALAITAIILSASAGLIHHVGLYFDHGARRVGDAEQVLLAVERLSADFGSARFELGPGTTGAGAAAFTGEPTKVGFVAAAGVAALNAGEEALTFTVEKTDELTRLVRRRAAWHGPTTELAELTPRDPVVLLEGRFDIDFSFGALSKDGSLTWNSAWTNTSGPPRLVRLNLRDRSNRSNPFAEAEFVIRSDAPSACAAAEASIDCLSNAAKPSSAPSGSERGTSQ